MNTLKKALEKELSNKDCHLRLEVLNELKQHEKCSFDYWQSWAHEGKIYDVNAFHHEDDIVFNLYATHFSDHHYETDTSEVLAELNLNWHVWKAMAAAMPLPTHNVELSIALSIDVPVMSLSAGEAIEQAINKFNNGELDIAHALEHCVCRAKITDDIPPVGDECYTFNLLESLSKEIDIYASSLTEAEAHLKNHLETHVKMSEDDSIGIDVLAEDIGFMIGNYQENLYSTN